MSPRVRSLALASALLASLAGCGESRLDYDEDRVQAEQSEIAREEGFLPVPEATEASTDTREPDPEPTTTSTTEDPVDASDYPAEADAICAEVSKAFAETQTAVPRSFEQAEELMSALSEIATDGEAALTAVVPPADRQAAFESYLAARAEVVELIDAGLAAAREEDGDGYQRAREQVVEGARDRERLARAAGLRRCAAGERA